MLTVLVEVSDSFVEFMNITFSFYFNSKHWLCNDGKVAGIIIQGLHLHYSNCAGVYVRASRHYHQPVRRTFKTVSQHFGAETKKIP